METILEMRNICKYFSGVRANHNVTFCVKKGEVHALLGENGAGKSTLMNVLCGLYAPTSGEIYYNGRLIENYSTKAAIQMGIGMVHQHFMLIPALTVVENVILGMRSPKSPFLDLDAAASQIQELAARYHMDIDPWAMVRDLSVGQQQRLEIIKALYRGAELLILDEPTAVLTPGEVEELFHIIRSLIQDEKTVILITHKLKEVMDISDRITVLSCGETVATLRKEETNMQQLSSLMVGHVVDNSLQRKSLASHETILQLEDVSCEKRGLGEVSLSHLSFQVCRGEIFGICGVDGNGQRELVELITGHRRADTGQVFLKGESIGGIAPRKILERGVSHIPEDRLKQAVVPDMTLMENTILMDFDKPCCSQHGILHWAEIQEKTNQLIADYQVKTPGPQELIKNLSGGNQQKLVVGRELSRDPELLVAVHPTRGLDIGATQYIHERLMDCRNKGNAVLVVSTEIEELLQLCDRIAVIYEGRIMGIVMPDIPIVKLGMLMAGVCAINEKSGKEDDSI